MTYLARKTAVVLVAALVVLLGSAQAQDSSSRRATQGKKKTVKEATVVASNDTKKGTNENGNPNGNGALLNPETQYTIGEQDALAINVWREPELSGVVTVRPDGRITLPLVNEVHVVGLTPLEVQAILTEKLRPFLNVPQVTVAVREINSRKVYVIGQVGREGAYRINTNTSILQLIAEAGGLREFANRKKIYLLRNEGGKQVRYPFNYDAVIEGKNPHQNIVVRPGDTLVVP